MTVPIYMPHSSWPWPLDAVEDWFNSLWDVVIGIAGRAARLVWDWIPSPLANFVGFLADLTRSLWDKILAFFNDPLGSIKAGFDWVISGLTSVIGWWDPAQGRFVGGFLGWLWDSVTFIRDSISGGLTWVWDQIRPTLTNIWNSMAGFVTLMAEKIGDIGTWLTSTIWGWVDGALRWASDSFLWLADQVSEGVGWAVDGVKTMFDGAVSGILGGFGEALRGIGEFITEGLRGVFEWFLGAIDWFTTTLVGGIVWIGERVGDTFKAVSAFLMGPITEALVPGSPPKEVENIAYAYVDNFQKRIMVELEKVKGSPAQPELAIAAGFGILGAMTAASVVGDTLAMAFDATHPLKKWGAQEMITHIKFDLLHSAFGSPILQLPVAVGILQPMRYAYNKMFTPLIPPIPDLIQFVVREVITPETFYDLALYHGYSKERATWYWDAHWILPAPANLYDAFHRGIINGEELDKYIVWHDFKPEPRPGISKSDQEIMRGIIKTLIPRVDLRYGWEMGRLSDEDLLERYEYLGYEDDSELMADIQKARAMVEEITKVRDEWIRYHIEGFIDEATLRANLEAVGIGPARIDYYVAYAQKRREREALKAWLGIYEDAYVKDMLTDEELATQAGEILVEPRALELFLEKAYISKYKKPKAS